MPWATRASGLPPQSASNSLQCFLRIMQQAGGAVAGSPIADLAAIDKCVFRERRGQREAVCAAVGRPRGPGLYSRKYIQELTGSAPSRPARARGLVPAPGTSASVNVVRSIAVGRAMRPLFL